MNNVLREGTSAALDGRLFLTVAEFARVARMDPRTVRRGIDADEIPAVRMGRTIRIPVPKVRAMLGLPEEASA